MKDKHNPLNMFFHSSPLKHSGYYVYHPISPRSIFIYVACFPYTTLTDWSFVMGIQYRNTYIYNRNLL
jgi:hypothetical protein